MPLILVFQKNNEHLTIPKLSEDMVSLLGVPCFLFDNGKKLSAAESAGDIAELHEGQVWVELPELQPDEGEPLVSFECIPRLERDESLQELIEEVVEQEPGLDEALNHNARDIMLHFEDTMAGIEAGNALAYIIAQDTESGILIPGEGEDEDDQESFWFETAEDFADAAFSSDDDEEEEEKF
jgi:hypothetical protein